jgi:hypothetical protein
MNNMTLIQRIHCVAPLLLSISIVGAGPSYAQDNRQYVGAGFVVSTQRSVVPGQGSSVPTTGLGGTTVGVSGEFGIYVTRMLSMAVEGSVPARFDSVQFTAIPTSRIESRHRDLVFSGLIHLHAPPKGPVRFAAIAGPSLIREDTLRRAAFASFGSDAFGPLEPERSLTRWTFGVSFGTDVAVQVNGHVQIVPQIRWHWIERTRIGETGGGVLGLSSLVTRATIGVRAVF